jgi:hypothetical protein
MVHPLLLKKFLLPSAFQLVLWQAKAWGHQIGSPSLPESCLWVHQNVRGYGPELALFSLHRIRKICPKGEKLLNRANLDERYLLTSIASTLLVVVFLTIIAAIRLKFFL